MEKDLNMMQSFLDEVKTLVKDGVFILDACRRLPKAQKNSLPAIEANTMNIMCALCQGGKVTELYLAQLKLWILTHLALVIVTTNSAIQVGRHSAGIHTFQIYSEQIWGIAMLSATVTPLLRVFEGSAPKDLRDHEQCLQDV